MICLSTQFRRRSFVVFRLRIKNNLSARSLVIQDRTQRTTDNDSSQSINRHKFVLYETYISTQYLRINWIGAKYVENIKINCRKKDSEKFSSLGRNTFAQNSLKTTYFDKAVWIYCLNKSNESDCSRRIVHVGSLRWQTEFCDAVHSRYCSLSPFDSWLRRIRNIDDCEKIVCSEWKQWEWKKDIAERMRKMIKMTERQIGTDLSSSRTEFTEFVLKSIKWIA